MRRNLRAVIRDACFISKELLSAKTCSVDGDGVRAFCTRAENTVFIFPRLSNEMRAAYVMLEDVCFAATNVDAAQVLCVRVHARLDSRSGAITIAYTLDSDSGRALKEMRLRVRVCGVLLLDACVMHRAFSGRTGGKLQSRHALGSLFTAPTHAAVHAAGAHLAVSDYARNCVNVFALSDFQFVKKLGKMGAGATELHNPHGLCFIDASTLLITDFSNDRVQHWTLDGESIALYLVLAPYCVSTHGSVCAVGSVNSGVCVLSLESGLEIGKWLRGSRIAAITFLDAVTLAVANNDAATVCLYTLEGTLITQLATYIISFGLAVCADKCLLVSDWHQKRVRVFCTNGIELDVPPFTAESFRGNPSSVALCKEHAYVLEGNHAHGTPRICVFE
jgi:hypothetical protein